MIHGRLQFVFSVLHAIALVLLAFPDAVRAQTRDQNQKLGFAIYKEFSRSTQSRRLAIRRLPQMPRRQGSWPRVLTLKT
jgi:hypothetical protein